MKRRILVIAYACEPDKGSEPAVGWNICLGLAQKHEVWVLTRSNNRQAIEEALAKAPIQSLHLVYFDLPFQLRKWKRGQRGIRLYYLIWLVSSWLITLRLDKQIHFDVIHHLTLSVCFIPNMIAMVRNNVVWGPIGGVESYPRSFLRDARWPVFFREVIRSLFHLVARYNLVLQVSLRKTAVVFVQTETTAQFLGITNLPSVEVMSSLGFEFSAVSPLLKNPHRNQGQVRVISIGRLDFIKGFHLGLRAFKEFSSIVPSAEYVIIGDGPERFHLIALARKLGIATRVRFLGPLPRAQVLDRLSTADVYLHTSLRDPPVFTLLEAMAMRVPVVCLASGGPLTQTTDATAIRVPLTDPDTTVQDLARELVRIVHDYELRQRILDASLNDVKERFSWQYKVDLISSKYEQIICR